MMWPGVVAALWEDPLLQSAIRRTGEVVPPEERTAAAADDLGDTGSLPTVGEAQ